MVGKCRQIYAREEQLHRMECKAVNVTITIVFDLDLSTYIYVVIFNIFYMLNRIRSKQDEYQEQYSSDADTPNIHQKEELDAAEALTFLAVNCKNRWIK